LQLVPLKLKNQLRRFASIECSTPTDVWAGHCSESLSVRSFQSFVKHPVNTEVFDPAT
jgi:hypothetical protein